MCGELTQIKYQFFSGILCMTRCKESNILNGAFDAESKKLELTLNFTLKDVS